jgi:hypothetical protein
MSGRIVVQMRIATTHEVPAYGGVRLAPRVLEQIAEAVRSGRTPTLVNHNRMNELGARCLNAEVVDLDDGHKAVDAEFEVDADAWNRYQTHLDEVGAPGGASFSATERIGELPPRNPTSVGQFAVYADAGYFADEQITSAAEELTSVGTVRTGRLYQFSAVQACRIVVEYVHASGGPDAATIGIEIGIALVSAAIYDCIKRLLAWRPAVPRYPPPPDVPPPDPTQTEPAQIEIHTTTTPGGVTVQTFQIRTNDEAVVRRALDQIFEAAARPDRPVAEWDDEQGEWRAP